MRELQKQLAKGALSSLWAIAEPIKIAGAASVGDNAEKQQRQASKAGATMPENTQPQAVPKAPKRRWFRFSLRGLLVLVVVLAVPLRWIAKERRQSQREKEIVADLKLAWETVEFNSPFVKYETLAGIDPPGWWVAVGKELLVERIVGLAGPLTDDIDCASLEQFDRLKYPDTTPMHISDEKYHDLQIAVPQCIIITNRFYDL